MTEQPRAEPPGQALLIEVLGVDLLGRLLGGESDAAPGTRVARVTALTALVQDLTGAYNSEGIRRWFTRPRSQLGGLSPVQTLTPEWTPYSPQFLAVRELAVALLSA